MWKTACYEHTHTHTHTHTRIIPTHTHNIDIIHSHTQIHHQHKHINITHAQKYVHRYNNIILTFTSTFRQHSELYTYMCRTARYGHAHKHTHTYTYTYSHVCIIPYVYVNVHLLNATLTRVGRHTMDMGQELPRAVRPRHYPGWYTQNTRIRLSQNTSLSKSKKKVFLNCVYLPNTADTRPWAGRPQHYLV